VLSRPSSRERALLAASFSSAAMLHALAVAAWVPAAPGKQALWCGARQLRSGAASLPLRPRLCPSPQMQAGSAREASTGGGAAAASVDALVDELSEVVATHARAPLTPSELHRSLQTITAKAAATLESGGAPPRLASVAARRTVAELKAELKARGLLTSGLKVRTALAVRCKGTTARVHSASTYYLLTTYLPTALTPRPRLTLTLTLTLTLALTLPLTPTPRPSLSRASLPPRPRTGEIPSPRWEMPSPTGEIPSPRRIRFWRPRSGHSRAS